VATLAIVGLLTSLAAPALHSLLLKNRMTTVVNHLMGALNLARSESIKRNAVVAICKSSDGASCSDEAGWKNGWIVFTDDDNNHEVDAGETVIHVQQSLEGGMTLRYGETGRYSYVRYNPSGEAWPAATFTVCDGRGADSAKAIIVYWAGRPRVSTKTSDGKVLKCP
jgi:type IV fimbrial biogenesis protein FimT